MRMVFYFPRKVKKHPPSPSEPSIQRRVTLRMVGEKAGVTGMAVSLALRNHPSIPPSTQRRIKQIARNMGYRPNAMVATLMASIHTRRPLSESPVLSLVYEAEFARLREFVPFYSDLAKGARERAAELGYVLEDTPLKMEKKAAQILYRQLHNRRVRGVIVAPLFHRGGICPLSFEGLACCALGYSLHKPNLHRVVPNYAQTIRLAWERLLEKGYRRPGFIGTLEQLERTYYARLGAFTAQQAAHPEVDVVPPLILKKSPDDHPTECLHELLAWYRQHRPDVLLSPPWILLEGLRRHIKVPEEAGVILNDFDAGWSQVVEGAYLIGSGAVDMVVAQIHRNESGVPRHPKTMALNSTWIHGFSLPDRRKKNKTPKRVSRR